MLADYYIGVADELLAKLRRLSSFTGHGPSVGATHEEFVKEAMRPFLSSRFSLRSGFVFAKEGVVSQQGDILIVDENDPSPYLFQLGNLVVVHPRAVAMVVEVKTSLYKSDFEESLQRLRSFRQVAAAVAPPAVFLTAIFAFEGAHLTTDTLGEWYKTSAVPDDPLSYPQSIFVLTEGALELQRIREVDGRPLGHRFVMGEEDDRVKGRTLSTFLATVRKAVEMKAGLESNPFEHSHLEGLQFSAEYLRLGVGAVGPGV